MISGISGSSTSLATWQSMMKQRQQDMSELSSALQSGDLSSAKSAFADLQSLSPGGGANQSAASSASTVSGSTGSNQLYNDLGALAQALKSGNMDDAQSAFADLESLASSSSTSSTSSTSATGSSDSSNPLASDVSALSEALSSGNLDDAQSAFSQLQSDMQAGGPPPQAGGPPPGPPPTDNSSSSSSSTDSSDTISSDFSALSEALDSNSLDDAQSAFAQLQSDLQSVGGTQGADNSSSSTTSMSQALAAYGQNSGQDPTSMLLAALGSLSDSSSSLSVSA